MSRVRGRILLVGLVSALALAPAAGAAVPGQNGRLVFQTNRDGASEVYSMRPDGSGTVNLTNAPSSEDSNPSFSPDGLRIAYYSFTSGDDAEIFVANADGSDPVQLTHNSVFDGGPVFSPDGRQIIFTGNRGGSNDVVVMDADGGHQKNLTDHPGIDAGGQFSPDGEKIVFVSDRESAGGRDVFTMNADGTDVVNLTHTPGFNFWPSFSPDGERIVFQTDRDAQYEIYSMNADGSGTPDRLTTNGAFDTAPSFSPDGTKIAFTSFRDGNNEIYVMNANGTSPVNRTNNPANDDVAYWGPAFTACQGGAATIAGTDGNDVLTGTSGPDLIAGRGGSDTIRGMNGGDRICGGTGIDTATYSEHERDVTADLGGGADDGSSEDGPAGARDSVGADVERLVGGFGDDVLRGDSKVNMLTGGAGDDLLAGSGGRDVLTGSSGDDRLQGGDGDDTLRGVTGDDVLGGGEGDDELDGGLDSDAIGGGPGGDLATYASRTTAVVVTVGAGGANDGGVEDGTAAARDSVGASVEEVVGGSGSDSLTGNELDNLLIGGGGSDSLFGLAGADSLNAADGVADAVIDCGASADPAAVLDLGIDPAPVSCG